MNKSPDAFRTISEVAEQLDVPAHVLRFWESRFSQVKPVKRGGGRRYYRPDDVRLLRGIRGLLYDDGLTIKGVQKILREQGVRHVIGLGTVDESQTVQPGAAPRVPVAPPAAEPALAAAGGPALPHGAMADGREMPAGDLFGAAAALEAPPAEVAEEREEIAPALGRKLDREALRRLVAELEALRRVMAAGCTA